MANLNEERQFIDNVLLNESARAMKNIQRAYDILMTVYSDLGSGTQVGTGDKLAAKISGVLNKLDEIIEVFDSEGEYIVPGKKPTTVQDSKKWLNQYNKVGRFPKDLRK